MKPTPSGVRRWLGRLVLGTSILLLVATVGMWVASQWVQLSAAKIVWVGAGDMSNVLRVLPETYRGSLAITIVRFRFQLSDASSRSRFGLDIVTDMPSETVAMEPCSLLGEWWRFRPSKLRWERWGFGAIKSEMSPDVKIPWAANVNGNKYHYYGMTAFVLALPWWFLTLLFSLAPVRALYKWKRHPRRAPHQCKSCGYDLRATPNPAGPRLPTCPECGAAD